MNVSELSTWSALCKDCRNRRIAEGGLPKRAGDAQRQEEFEYSEGHARRLRERGQSRSDRCPECRRRHRKEIGAFPVAYIDVTAIGEAADSADPEVGPTGPLGGLGPLPRVHRKRTERVDLAQFELGLTDADILRLTELMAENQVVVLEAGTGTGKSTLVPFRLMNPPAGAAFRPLETGPIVITEPRVRATKDVAAFVGEAMCFGHDPKECRQHIGPGHPVGYQCEGQKVWDDACNLIYATDGTVINWLVNGDLARFSVVVVDEAHERSGNIDSILTILAAQLPRYPHLRVIIASATIDRGYFVSYFSKVPTVRVAEFNVEAPKTIGYGVPLFADVEIDETVLAEGLHLPDDSDGITVPGWPDAPNLEEGGRSLRERTRDTLAGLRRSAPEWPRRIESVAVDLTLDLLRATGEGGILIFLPTFNSVQAARADLIARLENEEIGETVDVYWLMRATPAGEQELAVGSVPPGRRKVVIASNIAETSLTISDLRYVIDGGLVQQSRWDPDHVISYGACVPHSQSGVRQRWGRVGRKTHGWVFPLYTLAQFRAMPKDTPAGSTQVNLESTMLKLFAAGEDPRELDFPVDFTSDDVSRDAQGQEVAAGFTRERARALAALQAAGALTRGGEGLSVRGAELARSRLPADQATALMFADRLACVPEVATALMVLSVPLAGTGGILATEKSWPDEWAVHARRCHEAFAEGCEDDLELMVRIFAEWRAQADPERWARQWWIDLPALAKARQKALKLIESLAPGMTHEADRPLDLRLLERARAAVSRALPGLRYTRRELDDGQVIWEPTAGATAPLAVSPLHLVQPAGDVIALGRSRPTTRGWVSAVGQAFGIVAVRAWAAEGERDELDLILRARAGADEAPVDVFRTARERFPVGATLDFDDWSLGPALIVEKLSDGLQLPDRREVDEQEPGSSGEALVYSTSTSTSTSTESESESEPEPADTEGADGPNEIEDDLRGEVVEETAEIPEEELRLTPVAIRELENPEVEAFDDAEAESRPQTDPMVEVSFILEGGRIAEGIAARARVIGYESTADGVAVRVIARPATVDELEPGAKVRVAVTSVVRTHLGSGAVLRQIDNAGALVGEEVTVFDALADEALRADADELTVGTELELVAVPARRPGQTVAPTLAGFVAEQLRGQRSAPATLTTRVFRNYQDAESVLAHLDLPSTPARPGILVPRRLIDEAGIAIEEGARVRLNLGFNLAARRTGAWREEEIERLVHRYPHLFSSQGGRRLRFEPRVALTDAERDELLGFVGGDPDGEANIWRIWSTSRWLRALGVQAITDAELPPAARHTLTEEKLSRFRKQFGVGIVRRPGGTLQMAGSDKAVERAIAAINDELSFTRRGFELPAAGDRPPAAGEVVAALVAADPSLEPGRIASWVRGRKVWVPGWYSDPSVIESALRAQYDGVYGVLTFADQRGFYAFKKKERWEQVSDGLAVTRQALEEGSIWLIRAADGAVLDEVVVRFRRVASAAPFSEERGGRVAVTAIEQTTSHELRVDYATPRESARTATPYFVVIDGGPRLLVEEPVRGDFVARDPLDGSTWRCLGSDRDVLDFETFQLTRPVGGEPSAVAVTWSGEQRRAVAVPLGAGQITRIVKVVSSGASFLLTVEDEGAVMESAALDASRPDRESWPAEIDRRLDRVKVTVGGYRAELTPVAERDHEYRGTERHADADGAWDVWMWLP